MKKIKFTSGTIQKLTFDFYTIVLFNGKNQVYTGTIERLEAAGMIDKYYPSKISLLS